MAQLGSLVDSFREDMNVDVTLTVEGSVRTLTARDEAALRAIAKRHGYLAE